MLKENLDGNPKFYNADYIFHDLQIVAELKCLENNKLTDANYMSKIKTAWHKWRRAGLVKGPTPETIVVNSLPQQCCRELTSIASKYLKSPIKKANRQIRETKNVLKLPHYKGLLLLANDGNYAWPPDTLVHLAGGILYSGYTSIDNAVIFSVNMLAEVPGVDVPCRLWMPGGRNTPDAISPETLKLLAHQWFNFHDNLTGHANRRFGDV